MALDTSIRAGICRQDLCVAAGQHENGESAGVGDQACGSTRLGRVADPLLAEMHHFGRAIQQLLEISKITTEILPAASATPACAAIVCQAACAEVDH